jgi:hypothetical protein
MTKKMVLYIERAVFQQDGTDETNQDCREAILFFGTKRDRAGQFKMVREIIMERLWHALKARFGYPILEKEQQ